MQSAIKHICPVCGFLLDYPAADFNICPSCGVEFEADTIDHSFEELRDLWTNRGMTWTSRVAPKPRNYNPALQMQNLFAHGSNALSQQDVYLSNESRVSDAPMAHTSSSYSVGSLRLQIA